MEKQAAYKILGVKKDATRAQLKSAYKKKCLEFHPDKNNKTPEAQLESNRKFQELTVAYKLITGEDGGEATGRRAGGEEEPLKEEPVLVEYEATLTELYDQIEITLNYTRRNNGVAEERSQKIILKPEYEFNKEILIPGVGNISPDRVPGDLLITLKQKPDSSIDEFSFKNYDLEYNTKIGFNEALLGWKIPIKHPCGETLVVSGERCLSNFTKMVVGYGMPLPDNIRIKKGRAFANLIVNVEIYIPESFTDAETKILKSAFDKIPSLRSASVPIPKGAKSVQTHNISQKDSDLQSVLSGIFGKGNVHVHTVTNTTEGV
jgi:DnaJ-class molecular chaperone